MKPQAVTGVLILSVATALAGCGSGWHPQKPPAPLPDKEQADLLIAQVDAFLDNGSFDSADANVQKLNALKPNLPPEYGKKIDDIAKRIATAKAKAPKN